MLSGGGREKFEAFYFWSRLEFGVQEHPHGNKECMVHGNPSQVGQLSQGSPRIHLFFFCIISVIWLPIGSSHDNNATVLISDDITIETLTPKVGSQSQEEDFGWLWEMDNMIHLGSYLVPLYQFHCHERCSSECHHGYSWKLAVEEG
jgi:hypothetical protein